MLAPLEKTLFVLLVAICLTATYTTFSQMFSVILRGQGQLHFDKLPQRAFRGLLALASQGRLIRHRRLTSAFHYAVAWGFLFYMLVNLVDVLEGMVPGFNIHGYLLGDIFYLLADLLGTAVLIGVTYFLLRRFAFQDPALQARDNILQHPKVKAGGVRQDSLVIGVFILIHIGFRLLGTAFLVAQEGQANVWQPVASLLASTFFSGFSPMALHFAIHFSWWIAVGMVVLFLPYFPYTKHAHLFMGPFNYVTKPERQFLGEVSTLDFDDESIEQFGAAEIFHLEPKRITDAFACIMCNRCQEVCPAYNTGKELSPAAIEINKRYYLKDNLAGYANGEAGFPLLDTVMSESALWACTACGACIDICPVGNEPMLDIMDLRRNQVMMESQFPAQLKQAFVGMERTGNPWNSTESRMEWTKGLDFEVQTVEENPDFEYLLWVGCAGAFNPDSRKVVQAVATIMHSAGVSFAVLGDAETCTGDSARRAGNEALFFELASGNIETLNAAGVDKKRIVTSCPHCFTALGKEYKPLGGNYTVFHHTQLISDLVGKGKLRLNGKTLEKVTFHDPCYLGRHNGEVEAPRDALTKAGSILLEMDRNKNNSFCCGAGGAQMWKEEEHGTQAVNVNRFEEAQSTGATTLAVGCPFCFQMMKDANQAAGAPMQVKDVAQVVLESMKA